MPPSDREGAPMKRQFELARAVGERAERAGAQLFQSDLAADRHHNLKVVGNICPT